MKVVGTATLIWVSGLWNKASPVTCLSCGSWLPIVSMNEENSASRRDDRRADRHTLCDRLGGVAHGVEAHHDTLGLAGELTDISAIPAALSETGPKESSEMIIPVVESMPMPTRATR